MPLRIDVRINDELIERLHIARTNENGGTETDSVNDYGVIRGAKERILSDEPLFKTHDFKTEPEWVDWLEPDAQFEHRYGDGAIVCLLKALTKLTPQMHNLPETDISTPNVLELEAQNEALRKRVLELEAALEAPPF